MAVLRHPVVAGTFYPAERMALREMVRGFLQNAQTDGKRPKAMIVPHAAYVYSGPIAASAYARLATARKEISRVVLFGPSHHLFFRGIAACGADYFEIPLGRVAVDHETNEKVGILPQVHLLDEAHRWEHSIEVQLPFLQMSLDTFTLAPFLTGEVTPEEVAEVIEYLWNGDETLVVVSSDLSHYYDYESAKRIDAATSRAIETLQPKQIQLEHACGGIPIQGLLTVAYEHDMVVQTVDQRNSGDTAGSRDEVVGYGAYVFEMRAIRRPIPGLPL